MDPQLYMQVNQLKRYQEGRQNDNHFDYDPKHTNNNNQYPLAPPDK